MADLVIHPPEITEPARYSWVKQWRQEINENSGLDLNAREEMFKQAKRIQDILAQMGSHSSEEDKDA